MILWNSSKKQFHEQKREEKYSLHKRSLWRRGFQTIYKFGHRYFRLRGVHFCSQNLINVSASRGYELSKDYHCQFPNFWIQNIPVPKEIAINLLIEEPYV